MLPIRHARFEQASGGVISFRETRRIEPARKRVVAFVDGQNLFHAAREAFGHSWPNYDVRRLSVSVAERMGWDLAEVRFYTGVPSRADNPRWHAFWSAKLAQMGREDVWTFRRSLRYRDHRIPLPDGTHLVRRVGSEKGIDIRIALDIVRLARAWRYDVALVFSQDQDLSEVADEIRAIAKDQDRWTKIASAFPVGPRTRNRRGINGTDWIRIDRQQYDACLDPRSYLPGR